MEKRTKYVIGGIVGAFVFILMVAALTLLIVSLKSSSFCNLTDEQPQNDLTILQNIPSKAYKAIANFAGYLKYQTDPYSNQTDQKVFMPLELNSIILKSTDSESQILTLDAKCAKFSLNLAHSAKQNQTFVSMINVELVQPLGDFNLCRIDLEESDMSADIGKHYACFVEKWYKCWTEDVIVLELAIDALEFQIGGNPFAIKDGKFSTDQQPCSVT